MLRKHLPISLLIAGVLLALILSSKPMMVYADDPIPSQDNRNCITCHEDLYFLHDTGKWYCLRESPMACVDCHGGDPNTLDKDMAHTQRSAHPIINEDVTKCQQCHPEECYDRVELFDQSAGISNVLVSAPITRVNFTEDEGFIQVTGNQQETSYIMSWWEVISLILLAGLVIVIHLVSQRRRA